MSSATCAVTYISVYTDSEPDKAFWGADDEEVSEGGIPRVIVLGYDGLPIQLVAPPSPDYIPGLEDPQTPPVPQDEDEREPMFVQAHDPDYVPEPIYPEYIPSHTLLSTPTLSPAEPSGEPMMRRYLREAQRIHRQLPVPQDEDGESRLSEEQPLPPVDSPTAESPGYVTESDPKEDPEEGDDGDDDDGDSSRDDADGEDEDDDEEEEHLALTDSAIIVPVDEPVFPPEET
ncbi:hypothetical protein Tco_1054038 [Tanacetum coccineum]|uniref:Uncharacterized protein n=1 Tax=Tanacetum coccineum TaxID=301880 RepID=A0ABQ5GVN6_9ASTR